MPIVKNNKNYGTIVKLIGEGPDPVLEHIDIVENGDYTPQEGTDGWNSIHVDVPAPEPILKSTTFTSNGTYHPEEGTDGWNEVTVQVSGPAPVSEGQFWIQNDSSSEQIITIPSPIKGFQTSPDNTNWSEPTGIVSNYSFSLAPNQRLYVKIDQIENGDGIFRVSDAVSLGGNISTLINELSDHCYKYLIVRGATAPLSISNLIIDSCTVRQQYKEAFVECYGLTDLPQFTCKTVSPYAFYEMFTRSSISELPSGLFSNIQSCEEYAFSRMFANTQITTIPVDLIRHIKTREFPFDAMFDDTPLSSIPEGYLDGATGQLQGLFVGCGQLKTVPQGLFDNLIGKVSMRYCFTRSGIESVPDDLIENIAVGEAAFASMFSECHSLTKAPRLPRDPHWDYDSYASMFRDCISLTEAPEIWAEWGAGGRPQEEGAVFYEMFAGCSSLIKGAKMHWNGPVPDGDRFRSMYGGCGNLEEVWADFTRVDGNIEWLNSQDTSKSRILHVTSGTSDMYSDRTQFVNEAWTIVEDYAPEYLPTVYNMLKFTNLSDKENSLHIENPSEIPFEFEQSMNGIDWSPLPLDGYASVDISFSDAIYIRSKNGFGSHGRDWEEWRAPRFNCTENFKVGGEINKLDKAELSNAFRDSSTIIDASEIVINETIISNWDPNFNAPFNGTFNNCPNLQRVFTIPDITSNGFRQFEGFFGNNYALRELRVEISNATHDILRWIAMNVNSSFEGFTLYKKFGSGVLTESRWNVVYLD